MFQNAFNAPAVPQVEIDEFKKEVEAGATIIDVREPSEYSNGHVPNAISMPLSSLGATFTEIPKDKEVYVICELGGRSYSAAEALNQAGVKAISVNGGTSAWQRAGNSVVTGNSAS